MLSKKLLIVLRNSSFSLLKIVLITFLRKNFPTCFIRLRFGVWRQEYLSYFCPFDPSFEIFTVVVMQVLSEMTLMSGFRMLSQSYLIRLPSQFGIDVFTVMCNYVCNIVCVQQTVDIHTVTLLMVGYSKHSHFYSGISKIYESDGHRRHSRPSNFPSFRTVYQPIPQQTPAGGKYQLHK